MRRKGERKLPKEWPPYAVDSIRDMIASGDGWFQAWAVQAGTPLEALSRRSKIEWGRVRAISEGGPITRTELTAFAEVWGVDAEIVISTMPAPLIE